MDRWDELFHSYDSFNLLTWTRGMPTIGWGPYLTLNPSGGWCSRWLTCFGFEVTLTAPSCCQGWLPSLWLTVAWQILIGWSSFGFPVDYGVEKLNRQQFVYMSDGFSEPLATSGASNPCWIIWLTIVVIHLVLTSVSLGLTLLDLLLTSGSSPNDDTHRVFLPYGLCVMHMLDYEQNSCLLMNFLVIRHSSS
jgi:hypothetical protein